MTAGISTGLQWWGACVRGLFLGLKIIACQGYCLLESKSPATPGFCELRFLSELVSVFQCWDLYRWDPVVVRSIRTVTRRLDP